MRNDELMGESCIILLYCESCLLAPLLKSHPMAPEHPVQRFPAKEFLWWSSRPVFLAERGITPKFTTDLHAQALHGTSLEQALTPTPQPAPSHRSRPPLTPARSLNTSAFQTPSCSANTSHGRGPPRICAGRAFGKCRRSASRNRSPCTCAAACRSQAARCRTLDKQNQSRSPVSPGIAIPIKELPPPYFISGHRRF